MDDSLDQLLDAIEQFKSEHGKDEKYAGVLDDLDAVSSGLSAEPEAESPGKKSAREAGSLEDMPEEKDTPGMSFDNPPKPSGEGSIRDNPLFQKAKARKGGFGG